MRLGRRRELPRPDDLASGLRSAAESGGHRPALTVLRPSGREEQGFASLAQWAAKGAHLLEVDLAAGPGTRVGVVGPPGWMPVAACLAAWWVGATVVDSAPEIAIVHESADGAPTGDVMWFGDAVDGAPLDPDREPVYAVEVQAFPDQPPLPRAGADLAALETAGGRWTQAQLIDAAWERWDRDAVLGIEVDDDPDPSEWLLAAAVRPFVTGRATVIATGVRREAAAGEHVGVWA